MSAYQRAGLVLAFALSCAAQGPTRQFIRIAGPEASAITGLSTAGALAWSNALPALAYRIQFSTNLIGTSGWMNVEVYHATGAQNTVFLPAPDPAFSAVTIPAGIFQMGDALGDGFANEVPVHPVDLGAFQIDRFEVTWNLWLRVYTWALAHGYDFDGPGAAVDPLGPVTTVSWHDCVKWCNARSELALLTPAYFLTSAHTSVYRQGRAELTPDCVAWSATGYRLPTEAEWEKAARGGVAGHRFPWTNVATISHAQANYRSRTNEIYDVGPTRGYHPDFAGSPAPAGCFPPNGYGVYDMAGNAWEWCWDWFSHTYYSGSPGADPRGPSGGSERVARGDSYYNFGFYARCAYRNFWAPTNRFGDFSFRCARSVP